MPRTRRGRGTQGRRARLPPRGRHRGTHGATSRGRRRARGSSPLSCPPEVVVSDRVQFTCNGEQVEVSSAPGESLLSVLREQLGIVSVKDGCAPQGQCGCCTVLVDG